MELGVYLAASLLGAGYMLNPGKQARDLKLKASPTDKLDPVGTNVYHSKDYYKVKAEEARRVIKNWEAGKDPISTNIIPMYYNTIHLKHQDVDKVTNPNFDKDMIYSVLDSFDEPTRKLIASKKKLAPRRVMQHVHDGERSGGPEWGLINGRPSSSKTLAEEGTLDQIGGSLLPNRGFEDFTHNNMVPFYGGRMKQSMEIDNRMGAEKLEVFTGQFKLKSDQKQEQGPMFSPTTGIANIYGNVEKRDMSRYIPSNLGKKNNELPFEQQRVGRGLNKGFTTQPSGGFHQMVRIMPTAPEDYHIDPVFEQEGRINHGKAQTQNRSLIQQLYKNKPELLVENKSGERNFTTVGAVSGRKIRPTVILRDTYRKNSRMVMAPAKMAGGGMSYIPGKAKVSSKVNFYNTPHRNAVLAAGKKLNDFGKKGYHNKLNERALTGTRAHLLNPKTWVTAVQAYFGDAARKTRKQHYVNHPRPNGNAKAQRPSALPAYDPDQVLKTTIRETTEDNKHKGFLKQIGGGKGPSYDPSQATKTTIRETTEDNGHKGFIRKIGSGKGPSYDPMQVAKTTIRETTENNRHKGNVNSAWKKHRAYDPMQVAKTTIRETTENKKHKGWVKLLGGGKGPAYNTDPQAAARTTVRETTEINNHLGNVSTWKKHVTYDPDQVAKTTVKETTEDSKHVGIAGPIFKKHIAYDPTQVAKTTIRETTEQDGHVGVVSSGKKKHVAYDPNDVARTTIKETTEIKDHIGGANRGTMQSGKGYMTTDWYANNTNRQFTSDYEYTGVANANSKKTRSYEDAYNAEVNTEKEHIAEGRAPTKQSIKVTNGAAQINMQVNKIEDDRLNYRSATKNSSAGNYFYPQAISYCTTTSDKNRLPQYDTRLDPALLDAFKKNPLTHSLHSYY